jgi:hypothetical protein
MILLMFCKFSKFKNFVTEHQTVLEEQTKVEKTSNAQITAFTPPGTVVSTGPVWTHSAIAMTVGEARVVPCRTTMNASTDLAMYSPIAPTISVATTVLASRAMKEMAISVPMSTSALFLLLHPSALRTPSAATYPPNTSANANPDSKETDRSNVETSMSAERTTPVV